MFYNIPFKYTDVLLHLSARLNIIQVEDMKKRLSPFVEQSHIHIILDFQDVRMVDCSMIGFLVMFNRKLKVNHSVLTLRNLKGHAKLIFDTLKLSAVIHIEEKKNCNMIFIDI